MNFRYKDYRRDGGQRQHVMTLAADEAAAVVACPIRPEFPAQCGHAAQTRSRLRRITARTPYQARACRPIAAPRAAMTKMASGYQMATNSPASFLQARA
jgi:hypothetical protein